MIKTLFIGSNWEALETFKTLSDDDRFNIVGLITQPDKPVGRKKILKETEIKTYAKKIGVEVFHTESQKDRYQLALDQFDPELIVCKSFGEFLPEFFIEYPTYKTINVHYSLLPKFRGAVPIQKAILEGENKTGITYVQMVKEMDAGPILKTIEEEIEPRDTNLSLRQRLVSITSKTIGDTLIDWVQGKIEPIEQNDQDATYCWQRDISKENAYVDLEKLSAQQIDRMVRAFIPWPVAWTFYNDLRLKIYEAEPADTTSNIQPGKYKVIDEELYVGTSDKPLKLLRVQLEGKTEMDAIDFARGQQI